MKIYSLYPQYTVNQERRTQSNPVFDDRRSGLDRRSNDRIKLDSALTKDIFVVRNKINSMQEKDPIGFTNHNANAFKALTDIINPVKKQDLANLKLKNTMENVKSDVNQQAGIIGGALASVMSVLLTGASSAVVALGTVVYIGCKSVKNVISSYLKKP
jgi:hypothetical protein